MKRVYINNKWRFWQEGQESTATEVRLPHISKELPFHYFHEKEYQMVCFYERKISIPAEWKDKRLFITIEGAAHSAELFLNGTKLSEHHCGYTSFKTELSTNVLYGQENTITIKVDSREQQNIPPFGYVIDYMTFGGLYREVYLEVKEKAYIEDVFVRTDIDSQKIKYRIRVSGKQEINDRLYLRTTLIKNNQITDLGVEELKESEVELSRYIENFMLWELDDPQLYKLKVELTNNDNVLDKNVLDEYVVRFGFRKACFEKDGFYLNNKKVKIRGLNRHQSYPYVGYAMPESMQKKDADILKYELGCNAVRTSHYPQSHYFVDRCDELGLLVFMEIPGWQYIGDEEWKKQAVENVKDMILQYRNHTSIILWGVRINESPDDDEFYTRTNAVAHELDDYRQTGGVRCHKKSSLLEDVYTYNDFVHDGKSPGCEPKRKVTSDFNKPYLISEYNGHMYPTKAFDCEEHRVDHALRHANVLDAVNSEEDIAGSFGWCMFDYNTHKDFGSGDRICYHGVMDMFRNKKLAALIYACQQEEETILELSSSMDIGEHPGCNRGYTYIFSNADSVRMYKNGNFIKEYTAADSPYKNLKHGPMLIDDYIGNQIIESGDFTNRQARILTYALNYTATHGYGKYPLKVLWIAIQCFTIYRMKPSELIGLFNKYIGNWGGTSTEYKFEAIRNGKVVKTIVKEPMQSMHLETNVSHTKLCERSSYDVSEIRIKIVDDNNNQMYFYNDPVSVKVEGPVELIGPKILPVRGGMSGVYIKTIGKEGKACVTLGNTQVGYTSVEYNVSVEETLVF